MKKTYSIPFLLALSVLTVGNSVEAVTSLEQSAEERSMETSQQVLETLNQEVIAYMSGDYVHIHDLKQPYDRDQQLQKLSGIDKVIEDAKKQFNDLPQLVSAAELFVLEVKGELFNGTTLSSADVYADHYLQLTNASTNVASTYNHLDLYELPYGDDEQIKSFEQWDSLSKEEKISYIISMKKLLRAQGNLDDGPSTWHVYELLEGEPADFEIGAANQLVKTLLGY